MNANVLSNSLAATDWSRPDMIEKVWLDGVFTSSIGSFKPSVMLGTL